MILLPGSVKECFEFGYAAFDLAERLQTPVFVLTDLDLGMNNWMSEPFEYPEKPLDRGKVLTAEELKKAGQLRALPRRGWRRDRLAHAAGDSASQGGVLYARLGAQRRGGIHREAGRVPGSDGPAGAQVRECAQAGSGAGGDEKRNIEDRIPGLWFDRLRVAREPGSDREGARR